MAIDFDAIKKKLDRLSGVTKNRSSMWRPTEGEEHTVRLLSFPDNDGQPFKELWFYYGVGNNRGLLAPYQFNDPDPIQELITTLRDDGSKESYELAKKLYPKMRTYAPVIIRGEEDKGVQIWGFGKTVYQNLLGLMLDEDYGDITDPTTGRDIKVVCSKQPGKRWAMTEVRPRGKQSMLSSETDQTQEWLSKIPNLDDVYSCKSYDELSKLVSDWLNEDESDSDTSNDTSAETAAASQKKFTSIDDAFDDLMSD
ncbi:hypothetical protein CL614_02830 [archaeon]|nr:hypothetical protein [archaeon]|tara:strand:+ start:6997 stop:7758 length:762 start_codon:yes stop_codon:yes gene_type:complete